MLLENKIEFSATVPGFTEPFVIAIDNDGVSYNGEDIEITVKRKTKGVSTEESTYKYTDGNWGFEGTAPSWIRFTIDPASGSQITSSFEGSFDIDPKQKYIEIRTKVNGTGSGFPIEDRHKTSVIITDLQDAETEGGSGGTKIHFFTDTDILLPQLPVSASDSAFGPFADPDEPTKDFFRLTSLHSASLDPQAYAICDGIICVQQDSTADLVNIILKPIQQPSLNFAPIKYIIYKGIKKDSIISGAIIAPEGNNRLTQTIWDSQKNRNESLKRKKASLNLSAPSPSDPPPPISSIGYDMVAVPSDTDCLYNDDKSIDNLFFKGSEDFQLPLVRGGWDIGTFNQSIFGLEIIYDSLGYQPNIGKARVVDNVVEVAKLTGAETAAVKLENRNQREEIINFMDPCAFFGSLYANKLYVRETSLKLSSTKDFTQKQKNKIYESVLKKIFVNHNRTYLDIRNEHGYSFNFYENYGNNIQIAYEESGTLIETDYYGSAWPLLIIEKDVFVDGNTSTKNNIEIILPVTADLTLETIENKLPLAYISQGYTEKSFLKNLKGKARFVELSPDQDGDTLLSQFTKERITLAVPNDKDEDATTVVSSYIRLKYLKRLEESPVTPPASSGIVLRNADYFDHLFIPVNMQIPYNSDSKIKSIVFDEEVYIDATYISDIQIDCIAKVGFAEDDNGNITLFAYASDIRNKAKIRASNSFALSGETRDEDGDYLSQIPKKYANLEFNKGELIIDSENVPYTVLSDTSIGTSEGFINADPNELFSIVITKTQFSGIIDQAIDSDNFSEKFRVYLGIINKVNATDDNDNPYTSFDLVLRGYKLITDEYNIVEVLISPNIKIYSNGGI